MSLREGEAEPRPYLVDCHRVGSVPIERLGHGGERSRAPRGCAIGRQSIFGTGTKLAECSFGISAHTIPSTGFVNPQRCEAGHSVCFPVVVETDLTGSVVLESAQAFPILVKEAHARREGPLLAHPERADTCSDT